MTDTRTGPPPEEVLVGFAAALRRAGLAVTADRTSSFVQAVSLAGYHDRSRDVLGRASDAVLLAGRQRAVRPGLHRLVRRRRDEFRPAARTPAPRQLQASLSDESEGGDSGTVELVAARASAAEVLRHRDVAGLSDQDRTRLAWAFDRLDVVTPMRRALRRRPHHRGAGRPAPYASRPAADRRRAHGAAPPPGRRTPPADRPAARCLRLHAGLRRLAAPAGPPDRSRAAPPGRGLHHRDPAHPDHPGARPAAARARR